jgi:bifunctional non-homologous end joining protein LigD
MTRVLFPESGFTTRDAVAYYRGMARWLLPHLRNVPVSFKRYPDTISGESFWEKDAPSFTPAWVRTLEVPRRSDESEIHYIVIDHVKTLVWLAEAGGIEIHPFLHRAPRVEEATAVVFDLDPGSGATLRDCCRVAVILRDTLAHLGLESLAKVSGSKGLQVYVPLNSGATHDATLAFSRIVAEEIAKRHPRLIVAKMAKELRTKKVLIDWSQNADYKTTVAVYSLRAKKAEPFVSMPVTWEEVEESGDLVFSPDEALQRVRARGDLFRPVLTLKQKLPIDVEDRRPRLSPRPGQARVPVPHDTGLPKPKSQSGRRLFVVVKTEQAGDELWLDMHGKFKRWILRGDREGGSQLVAMPAGDFAVDPAYYRGEVPAAWRKRVTIDDIGAYEVIEGSYQRHRFDLWFSGKTLQGEWLLRKARPEPRHRSWILAPVR